MPKINIKSLLKTKEEETFFETKGIFEEDRIKYKEKDCFVKIDFQKEEIKMERKKEDSFLVLNFSLTKETDGIYQIHDLANFSLNIKTKELLIQNQKIHVRYLLYLQEVFLGEFDFQIEFEVLS